jgi:cytochrome c oxidase subunit 3
LCLGGKNKGGIEKMEIIPSGEKHPYHLVNPSPWPLLTSFSAFILGVGGVLYMHQQGGLVFGIGVVALLLCLIGWWSDVLYEADTEKKHNPVVQWGLKYGFALFIISEIMFFGAFFWSYFDASLFPAEATGFQWPPKGIHTLDPFKLPYLNTLLLLLSASSLTWSHEALKQGEYKDTLQGLIITVMLGAVFTGIQAIEYHHAPFKLTDGIYGSNFYLLTGFHGMHVIIGTTFLAVCLWRVYKKKLTSEQHVGFETAAWYWHFVDVVWLFLFVFIYWAGA